MEIKQNTLYITTQHCYMSRDHLTLKIEVEKVVRMTVPIHHIDSVCIFGNSMISPHAAKLCWEHGVAVNFFSEDGYFLGKWEGVPNTSVLLRRAQFRLADDPVKKSAIARQMIAGKIQNCRQSMLRSARETDDEIARDNLHRACGELGKLLESLRTTASLEVIRGIEGMAAQEYFRVFRLHFTSAKSSLSGSVRGDRH